MICCCCLQCVPLPTLPSNQLLKETSHSCMFVKCCFLHLFCLSSSAYLSSIRIPHAMKMTTLSPKNATISSPHSIPSGSVNLTLILFNLQHYNDFLPFLPPTLTHIVMKHYPNQSVDMIPSILTHLITEHVFNQPVNNLPQTLTHLKTSTYFNQPVNNHHRT